MEQVRQRVGAAERTRAQAETALNDVRSLLQSAQDNIEALNAKRSQLEENLRAATDSETNYARDFCSSRKAKSELERSNLGLSEFSAKVSKVLLRRPRMLKACRQVSIRHSQSWASHKSDLQSSKGNEMS